MQTDIAEKLCGATRAVRFSCAAFGLRTFFFEGVIYAFLKFIYHWKLMKKEKKYGNDSAQMPAMRSRYPIG